MVPCLLLPEHLYLPESFLLTLGKNNDPFVRIRCRVPFFNFMLFLNHDISGSGEPNILQLICVGRKRVATTNVGFK